MDRRRGESLFRVQCGRRAVLEHVRRTSGTLTALPAFFFSSASPEAREDEAMRGP